MPTSAPRLWLDLVDPLSRLVEHELRALEARETVEEVLRSPLELRPPPAPLLDPEAEPWAERWRRARELAGERGVLLEVPRLVPWSRKAWELVLHGREVGAEQPLRDALFRAFHEEGTDVGRVDVLVELAASLGLDTTRAKAVLDVDRHAAAVAESAREAGTRGADTPPALWTGSELVQGFHDRDALRTLLVP